LAACDETFEVVLWPKTPVSTTAMIRCAEIHSSFPFGPYITRRCNVGEMWGVPDFSNCTMRSDSTPLVVVSVNLGEIDGSEERPNALLIQQMVCTCQFKLMLIVYCTGTRILRWE